MCSYMPKEFMEEEDKLMDQKENDPIDGDMDPLEYCLKHGSESYRTFIIKARKENRKRERERYA